MTSLANRRQPTSDIAAAIARLEGTT